MHHNFDPAFGALERQAQVVLFNHGHTVILKSERATVFGRKMPDGILNGNVFEIKAVLGTGKNNIKNKLLQSRSQGCSHLVLYYPVQSLFSMAAFTNGFQKYKGVLRIAGDSDPLINIWAIVAEDIVVLK